MKRQAGRRGGQVGPPVAAAGEADERADAGEASGRGSGGRRRPVQPAAKTGRFRGWRGWVLRVSLLVLGPLLFFVLLEGGLRLGGYGYATKFLLGPDADGNWTSNYRFGWRFFPRPLARDPQPCVLSAKPAGAVRIFVLGGSAAMGTPDPAFSFGRILEVMLREQFPGTRIEVVNGAITAINSHVVLEIARDCAAREPDLFVVYLGNNEVVGPYGPGTVFQQWSPSLGMVRTSIRVKSTRVGQLLGEVAGSFRRDEGPPARWRGMEMFLDNPVTAEDPRLAAVYGNFRQNLGDICGVARRTGAGVVLSTVAVNLRDCPPLASLHRPDLDPTNLAQWDSFYQAGGELAAIGRWPEALEACEAAAKIDDRFAELQFRLGECLMQVGRAAEARVRFESARDLDILRFRADSRINATIREVAAAQESTGVRLVDAERALAESNPDLKGVPGGGLFHEHVHLTFDGNYQLARAVFDQVRAALPQLAAHPGQGAIPSRQRCAELLALTSWDEAQLIDSMVDMTSKAPFTNQFNHKLLQDAARRRSEELRRAAESPEAQAAAWKSYEAALAQSPDDWLLHQHFGRLAMHQGRLDVAVEHLRIAAARLPRDASIHNNLGNALAGLGKIGEAIGQFQEALELNPGDEMAHYNLGNMLAGRGRLDEAISQYQEALESRPDYEAAHFNLGNALARRGRTGEAITHYRRAVEIEPVNAEAHTNLGVLLAGRGNFDEAIGHLQQALEIRPDDPSVRRNLERAQSDRQKSSPRR